VTVRTPMLNTDTDTAETFRLAMGGLWVPASALNARTGVTSVPTLTSTGALTANISPFTCVIDGTSNSLQGAYPVANDNVAGITITTGSSQARIDLICLQIQDNDYDGSGQHRGIPVVVAGTPSGSPAAPATPANAIPLWTLPVPALASSVTFSTATAVYPYTAAAGGAVYVRGATDKPAVVNGFQMRYRGDVTPTAGGTSAMETSVDGVTYTPVFDASVVPASTTAAIAAAISAAATPSWTAVTAAGTFGSGITCSKIGNIVTLRGSASAGSQTWTAGNFYGVGTLPAGFIPSLNRFIAGVFYVGNEVVGQFVVNGIGALNFTVGATVTSTMIAYLDGVSFSL